MTESESSGKMFVCRECGFGYLSEKLAKDCEEFCRKNKSCSPDIVKHAVKQVGK